ncbi:hypothetical protein CVT24_007405 [Panaeolus cyanescens]|uniref:G domain-containing protein n=1 Tax=Panaeolus cyanescens TaxID=181874 RepID=A0A409YL12_9AGAR|nr:hypothetical protein CVT24_007405 [Panaeolus cyanescens]
MSVPKSSRKKTVPTVARKDDIIIAVMGPIGVGKSNDRIVLVDTPGYDDTTKTDQEILSTISRWLKERITDNRLSGNHVRNLRTFGELCGEAAADRVAFITTMWDVAEAQGKQEHPVIDCGAVMKKFDNTTDSAWEAVQLLLDKPHQEQDRAPSRMTQRTRMGDDDDRSFVTTHTRKSTSVFQRFRDKLPVFQWTKYLSLTKDQISTPTTGEKAKGSTSKWIQILTFRAGSS